MGRERCLRKGFSEAIKLSRELMKLYTSEMKRKGEAVRPQRYVCA